MRKLIIGFLFLMTIFNNFSIFAQATEINYDIKEYDRQSFSNSGFLSFNEITNIFQTSYSSFQTSLYNKESIHGGYYFVESSKKSDEISFPSLLDEEIFTDKSKGTILKRIDENLEAINFQLDISQYFKGNEFFYNLLEWEDKLLVITILEGEGYNGSYYTFNAYTFDINTKSLLNESVLLYGDEFSYTESINNIVKTNSGFRLIVNYIDNYGYGKLTIVDLDENFSVMNQRVITNNYRLNNIIEHENGTIFMISNSNFQLHFYDNNLNYIKTVTTSLSYLEEVAVFEDFFLIMSDNYISKYDFNGNLLKKINFSYSNSTNPTASMVKLTNDKILVSYYDSFFVLDENLNKIFENNSYTAINHSGHTFVKDNLIYVVDGGIVYKYTYTNETETPIDEEDDYEKEFPNIDNLKVNIRIESAMEVSVSTELIEFDGYNGAEDLYTSMSFSVKSSLPYKGSIFLKDEIKDNENNTVKNSNLEYKLDYEHLYKPFFNVGEMYELIEQHYAYDTELYTIRFRLIGDSTVSPGQYNSQIGLIFTQGGEN